MCPPFDIYEWNEPKGIHEPIAAASNNTIYYLVISSHSKSCLVSRFSEETAANTGLSAKETSRCYLGLLVVPVGDSANTFKRVGMVELHESQFGPGELDCWTTFTLV